MSHIGNLVQAVRADLGVSRHTLSHRLGVTSQTIGAWEKGLRQPRYTHLLLLIDLIGRDRVLKAVEQDAEDRGSRMGTLNEC